ncbi:hypothetical protein ZHAS_00002398 [Anopheles sinensis]|uniref:Uncharacterized protein n=1 Tax=Anopheles sinensis TaxID=74873 RepID=A0A084VC66_ANOSI|nr:hypothetical protein ZHAS_00002398 [Anopheles sinensis]
MASHSGVTFGDSGPRQGSLRVRQTPTTPLDGCDLIQTPNVEVPSRRPESGYHSGSPHNPPFGIDIRSSRALRADESKNPSN